MTHKTLRYLCGAIGVAAILASCSGPAYAQQRPICDTKVKMEAHLLKKYKEEPAGVGLHQSGKFAFRLYVSPKGTWTFARLNPNGTMCLMTAGKNWQTKAPPKDTGDKI